MRHPKLAALTVALTAVLVMPVTQSVAQPFPFDPGSFGNGSTGSLGSDDPDIPIEDTLPQLSVTTLVDGLDHPLGRGGGPGRCNPDRTTIRRILRSPRRQHDRSSRC